MFKAVVLGYAAFMSFLRPALLALSLPLVLGFRPLRGPEPLTAPPVAECGLAGDIVPDFQLQDVNPNSPTYGQTFRRDELLGKVLVLYFAQPTCPVCQAEVPILQSMWDEHKSEWTDVWLGIVALAGYDSGLPDLTAEISLPVLMDTEQDAVADAYGAAKWYLYFTDREGTLQSMYYSLGLQSSAGQAMFIDEVEARRAGEP